MYVYIVCVCVQVQILDAENVRVMIDFQYNKVISLHKYLKASFTSSLRPHTPVAGGTIH
jgi:hypothetical protein